MPRCLFSFALIFISCSYLVTAKHAGAAASPFIGAAPTIIKEIAYGDAHGDRRRSLDLYMPAKSAAKPALLIFIHGGFWLLSDDDYRIGPALAGNFVNDGVAVALVRYRLAPASRHPAQADDVAAAVGYLIKRADDYGFDSKRVLLAGHSAGGHLASLVALDRHYLDRQGLPGKALAGVISLSGLYDLTPSWEISENQKQAMTKTFGADPAILKQASPIQHVRVDTPPFLIVNASQDFTGFVPDAQRFSDALRSAGNRKVEQIMFKDTDHFTLVKLDGENNRVRRSMLDFMGVIALSR
jgi:arylformamidase